MKKSNNYVSLLNFSFWY